jgi:hypothetical protein
MDDGSNARKLTVNGSGEGRARGASCNDLGHNLANDAAVNVNPEGSMLGLRPSASSMGRAPHRGAKSRYRIHIESTLKFGLQTSSAKN